MNTYFSNIARAEITNSSSAAIADSFPDQMLLAVRKVLVVLGIPVDCTSMEEVLERLDSFVQIGRATGRTHQVATVNVDFVVNALHDPELHHILQGADLATADGMPLVWGARMLGTTLKNRVTGIDLVHALAGQAAKQGYSIYLLGAKPGVAAQAAALLRLQHPELRIAGVMSPSPASLLEIDSDLINDIQAARPDILLVAFGNPKQEKWISMYAQELHVPVCIGVGGSFDMIAGATQRAPVWIQQAGFEWLFRLAQEPRRLWKRYSHDFVTFGVAFFQQWWEVTQSRKHEASFALAMQTQHEHIHVLNVAGHFDVDALAILHNADDHAATAPRFAAIDMAATTSLAYAAIGPLIAFANTVRAAGGNIWLLHVPAHIQHTLAVLHLSDFFDTEAHLHAFLAQQPMKDIAHHAYRVVNGWCVVDAPRRVDSATVAKIFPEYAHYLDTHGFVVIDMSDTILLSSSGIARLQQLAQQAYEIDGLVRVAGCSQAVLHSIEQAHMHHHALEFYATCEQAVTTYVEYIQPNEPMLSEQDALEMPLLERAVGE